MKHFPAVRALLVLLLAPVLTGPLTNCFAQDLKPARKNRPRSTGPAETRLRPDVRAKDASVLIQQLTESGWVLSLGQSASERVSPAPQVAPGRPPLLEFRYLNEVSKYGLDRLRLVVDDAGH